MNYLHIYHQSSFITFHLKNFGFIIDYQYAYFDFQNMNINSSHSPTKIIHQF
jgi:hypothetical protein